MGAQLLRRTMDQPAFRGCGTIYRRGLRTRSKGPLAGTCAEFRPAGTRIQAVFNAKALIGPGPIRWCLCLAFSWPRSARLTADAGPRAAFKPFVDFGSAPADGADSQPDRARECSLGHPSVDSTFGNADGRKHGRQAQDSFVHLTRSFEKNASTCHRTTELRWNYRPLWFPVSGRFRRLAFFRRSAFA